MVRWPRKLKKRAGDRVKTSLNLPRELKVELKVAAAREEREMSELITEALEAYLAKKREPKSRQDRSNG